MRGIDCRNMACPAPVIAVKKALEQGGEVRVLLDDGAPRENVSRFARNRGYRVEEEREGEGWALTITGNDSGQGAGANGTPTEVSGARMLLITSNQLGTGPEELGKLLMKNFIHTLLETDHPPGRMFFMNSGVLLTTQGSELLEGLHKLATRGVEILSCGLCLDYYGLKDRLQVGGTTNMLTTIEGLLAAGQIITL